MIIGEIWMPVAGFEGAYEVSDWGRVRSRNRFQDRPPSRRHPRGRSKFYRGQMLEAWPTSSGHLVVSVGGGGRALVHRLVLMAFVGPCPDGHEGAHGDDEKANNRLSNLRWATRSSNALDAYRNGRRVARKGLPRKKEKA